MIATWKDSLRRENRLRLAGASLEAARRLSDLYDFAPIGYITLDSRGAIRESNLTAARLLGVESGLLVNRPFALFVAKGGIRPFMAHLRKCRSLEKAATEIPVKVKGGGVIWTEMTSIPVHERDELLLRTGLIDRTRRKNAEEEIKR